MPSITSTGIGSGLDVNAIVKQLVAVEARPLTMLQKARTELDAQLSSFGKLQGLVAAMRDSASALASPTLWNRATASSGDTTAVAVTAAAGAPVGSYAVKVHAMAAPQTLSSTATWPFPDSLVPAGSLTIELGRWEVDGSTTPPSTTGFSPKSGSSALNVEVADGDSLSTVRDKINAAGAGVVASLVTDAGGTRLALRSATTGADNAFRVEGTGGVSALAYDARSGTNPMQRAQVAADARASVNGIEVSASTNTLEGVVDGLTVKLLRPTSTEVGVTVAADDPAVKAGVDAFVKSYNELAAFIREQTKYDAGAKSGGALQGDRTVLGLQSQLRGVINAGSSASSVFSRLSDVGVSLKVDGTLEVNGSRLDDALAGRRSELRAVLAADAATGDASGFVDRFRDLGNAVLDSTGSIASRNASLSSMISRNDKSQSAMSDRLAQTEARLRAQYQALDASMAKLNGLSSYLGGQLAALTRSSGG